MSPVTSNAIVITYPSQVKRATVAGIQTRHGDLSVFDPLDMDNDFRNSGGGPKKRRRLTHLSPDEKLLRRKLKNRVAAQTARDRKKAQLVELEEKLAILEEENELLRLQNISLKEASSKLAKENAVLMRQLADQQLTTTETDSETKSTLCSSAEGAGSESASVRDTVHHYGNSQPDNFLGLLQELVEESKCEWPQVQMATPLPQIATNQESSTSRMVGLTSTELETLNQLISIDHVYVKPQPPQHHQHTAGKEGNHKAATVVRGQSTNNSISSQNNYNVCLSESKFAPPGGLNCGSFLASQNRTSPFAQDIELNNRNISFTSSPSAFSSSLSSLSPQQEITNNFISLLSCSDVEKLKIAQSCDYCEHELYTEANSAGHTSLEEGVGMALSSVVNQSAENTENEQIATDLFHEIYEHYLNLKDSCYSDSNDESDSGICNDFDEVSPQGSEESLDDLMWHETPFGDLFPDLH